MRTGNAGPWCHPLVHRTRSPMQSRWHPQSWSMLVSIQIRTLLPTVLLAIRFVIRKQTSAQTTTQKAPQSRICADSCALRLRRPYRESQRAATPPSTTPSQRWATSGCFFGNWGLRGTVGGNNAAKLRRETQDRQILKSPGQVVVLVEASKELEELLRLPAVAVGDSAKGGLQGRDTHEHFVVRGDEQSAVLIAARTDNTTVPQVRSS